MITTSQTLVDGPKNLVILLNAFCDDGVNEIGVVKVDVSEVVPSTRRVRICEISGNVNWGVVTLAWSDTPDRPFLVLEGQIDYCFEEYGDLHNIPAEPGNGNGDIILTTSGFDVGSNYSLFIRMAKQQ